jgi:DNA-binding GntR family transcriptional regulator
MKNLRDLVPDTPDLAMRSDAVFEALRKAVLEGKLLPGERLRQEQLAEAFGVSQITVRESLNRLIAEGLAMRAPYKGVRVIELSLKELEEAYSLRGVLEGWAAELAAAHITPDELAQLRQLLPDSYVTADPASVDRARRTNRAFHELIIGASRHRLLTRMLKEVWNRLDPMTFYGRMLPTQQGEALRRQWGERDRQNHTDLLAALENRDGYQARQLVTGYIQETWTILARSFESQERTPHDEYPH